VETSYWQNGLLYGNQVCFGRTAAGSAINQFKAVVDTLNREFHDNSFSVLGKGVDRQVAKLTFGQNAILVTKKDAGDRAFDDREYRHSFLRDYYFEHVEPAPDRPCKEQPAPRQQLAGQGQQAAGAGAGLGAEPGKPEKVGTILGLGRTTGS
jgi:hypothetical protein